VIINDKLSQEETFRLITVLEKHRLASGYSLQDLKGINPALCTRHIPTDPNATPSRESSSMTDQTVEQTRGLMATLADTIGKSNARIDKLVIRQKSTKTFANTLCHRLDELEKDEE
jgi:hypothetical protein